MPGPMFQMSVMGRWPLDGALELRLVHNAYAVVCVLRRNVERHLRQKEVRPDAGCGDHPRFGTHRAHEHARELARAHAVERKVGRRVDEAFVYGVRMDVLGRDVAQVDGVDVGRHLHVAPHARTGHDVVGACGDVEHAATPRQPEGLQSRRDGQADGLLRAVGIGHHEVGGEGVKPAVGALDARVEAFQVDAQVRALLGHAASLPSPITGTLVRIV